MSNPEKLYENTDSCPTSSCPGADNCQRGALADALEASFVSMYALSGPDAAKTMLDVEGSHESLTLEIQTHKLIREALVKSCLKSRVALENLTE